MADEGKTPRPPRRKPGQPSKLTPDVAQAIAGHVARSVPFADACELEGIDRVTGQQWLARGRGEHERPATSETVEFVALIRRARALGKAALIEDLRTAEFKGETSVPARTFLAQRLYPEDFADETTVFVKARGQVAEVLLARLRERLDPETYGRVVSALAEDGGDEAGSDAEPTEH